MDGSSSLDDLSIPTTQLAQYRDFCGLKKIIWMRYAGETPSSTPLVLGNGEEQTKWFIRHSAVHQLTPLLQNAPETSEQLSVIGVSTTFRQRHGFWWAQSLRLRNDPSRFFVVAFYAFELEPHDPLASAAYCQGLMIRLRKGLRRQTVVEGHNMMASDITLQLKVSELTIDSNGFPSYFYIEPWYWETEQAQYVTTGTEKVKQSPQFHFLTPSLSSRHIYSFSMSK